MAEALKILFVEDVQIDADLEVRELRRTGMKVEFRRVESEASFLDALREFKPDVILSDFSMPEFDGMSALGIAKIACPNVPFIFVSGTLGEEYAIRALQKGAADYVLKTNLIRLPAAVSRAVADAKERAERRSMEAELEQARQRLSNIVEALDDAVWSWSTADQCVAYIGPAAQRIFGHEPEKFYEQPDLWRRVIHDQDRGGVFAAWQQLLDGTAAFDADYRVVRADGEVRWINNRARVVRSADGRPERVDGVIRDINDRMVARNRILRLTRLRSLSSAVNAAIVRLRERRALLARVCEIAVDIGEFDSAAVALVAGPGGAAELLVAHGPRAQMLAGAVARYNDDPAGSGEALSRALRTGQTAIADLPESNAGAAPAGAGVSATAAFPLSIRDEIVGILMLEAVQRDGFDQEEVRLLEELAANVAFALELISHQERLDYLAYYDVLTGLSNRTLFNDRLSQALTAAGREAGMLALVVCNVVQLRAINETFGERAGDAVLCQVSEKLKGFAGDPAGVARLGGDLFALMIPGVKGLKHVAQLLAEEKFGFFNHSFAHEGRDISVVLRGGVALYPNDGADADALLHNAEAALDQARKTTQRLLFYSEDANARIAERRKIESRLQLAVERQEFELHYQPKLDLHARRIVGLEALLRWNDPDRGLVPPAEFIQLLEETGLILELGRWAMKEAVTMRRKWQLAGMPAPRIAVNVSALQLKDKRFVQDVAGALAAAEGDVGLDLEITESMLMENVHEGVKKLCAVREMGVQLAIDDFGTGYSSLSYISTLPVNTLKIDRSFINGMTEDPAKTGIVTTIISLGHGLRMEVVAEGVENEAQSQLLRLLRCDQIQGYLISKPVPAQVIEPLLAQSR
ncbi:MAG TPA: EAL domain-containing protein [Burkholderiales bacterium]|nr:EAL domain-containing protein [Burkholderiales bacterium]